MSTKLAEARDELTPGRRGWAGANGGEQGNCDTSSARLGVALEIRAGMQCHPNLCSITP